jgi:hypothetical protein
MRQFTTAREVIDALGGPKKFGDWYGVTPKCVTMWRKRGFPSSTSKKLDALLRTKHQIIAHPSCWPQLEAVE